MPNCKYTRRLGPIALLLALCSGGIRAADPPAAAAPAAPKVSIVEDRAARKLLEAGDARYDSDEIAKAVEVWNSVIERYPRSKVRFDAHMRVGNYLLDRERAFDRARPHFEAVAIEDNKDEEQRALATLKTGVCFYEARNFGKSFKIMRDVIDKFPVSPQVNQAYYYIGLGHFQLGHYSRAIAALEKVGTTLAGEAEAVDRGQKVEAGKRLFIKVEDADLAALPADQVVKIRCETTQGDVEIVDCAPVGRNVRVVLGSILTELGKPRPNSGIIELSGKDQIHATYVDQHTADRQFDRKVLKDIQVVGNALVDITDGAYSESLNGVVLGKPVNLQITDADRDVSDSADKLKAVVEIYREKTAEEIEAEQTAVDTAAKAGTAPPADAVGETGEAKVNPLRKIDAVEITFVERKIPRKLSSTPADSAGDGSPADAAAPSAAPGAAGADSKSAADAKAAPDAKATAKKAAGEGKAPTANKTADAKVADKKAGDPKSKDKKGADKKADDKTAKDSGKQVEPTAEAEVDDGSIHSGVFVAMVSLVKDPNVVADDDTLQALPNDIIRVRYSDELNSSDSIREVLANARGIEGNLGGVRVTRAQIGDRELRIQTQLKTASALTNIGNRYKEFGLKKNAEAKYQQALKVCDEISTDASKLGGRLLEETYVQLWQIYYEMDQLDMAAAMCQRLQTEFPNSGFVDDALLQLANVVRKQGDIHRAIGIYSKLVEMQTSQLRGEAQFGVAECYEDLAKRDTGPGAAQLYDRSFQEYKKVFDRFPESGRVGEAVAKMASYYYQQKDYARAVDIFESVLADHPDAKFLDVILFNYGRCLFRMDRGADARRQFDQLIADFPESPLAVEAKRISEALAKAGSKYALRPSCGRLPSTIHHHGFACIEYEFRTAHDAPFLSALDPGGRRPVGLGHPAAACGRRDRA